MSILNSLVILAIAGIAATAPQGGLQNVREQNLNTRLAGSRQAKLLRYDTYSDGLGSYKFIYQQDDGQGREEQGVLNNPNTENETLVVQGSYTWIGPDGVTYLVRYTADENGFRPIIEQSPGGAVPSKVIETLSG